VDRLHLGGFADADFRRRIGTDQHRIARRRHGLPAMDARENQKLRLHDCIVSGLHGFGLAGIIKT